MQSRRSFFGAAGMGALSAGTLVSSGTGCGQETRRPSILLVITDDQGYGDLGCHGNSDIATPRLDALAAESVEFTHFQVCPVCAPTRASLMTGRYNYRTCAIDTWKGRAMMHPDELTIADLLHDEGYRTGIFGKWHLGDCYPMRTVDHNFDESVVHRGGGLCQPSDFPANTYFDPILIHNDETEKYTGYCMDVYTDEAIKFIRDNSSEPFFVYLPTNTPHDPLQVPEEYIAPYREKGLSEGTARLYGMITNIDDNMGRLLYTLDELNIAQNTIVIFMSDNGGWQVTDDRYRADLHGAKGQVYDGGIRVPFFIRWPERLTGGLKVDRIAAHIDIMPTLLAACGVPVPDDRKIDGVSLMALLTGSADNWKDRIIFTQWHRGDEPELYRCFAARSQRYKLLQAQGAGENYDAPPEFRFELYDMENDPFEKNDISRAEPDVLRELKTAYEAWFRDVSATRGYDPPKIVVGTAKENPVILTRQDWRGSKSWSDLDHGWWEIEVAQPGAYDILIRFTDTMQPEEEVAFSWNGVTYRAPVHRGIRAYSLHIPDLALIHI